MIPALSPEAAAVSAPSGDRPTRRTWSERVSGLGAWYTGVTLLLTLITWVIGNAVFHDRAQRNAQAALQRDVERLARQLDRVVDQGLISGALRLMGTTDDRIKERITQGRPVDMAARALSTGADGLLLVDLQGRVLDRWDPDHERSTAPVWATERDPRDSAGASVDTWVQVTADTATLDHSLLLIAPIWSGANLTNGKDAIIGSLVARLDPGTVRRYVAMSDARITLVAPNGRLVGASTASGSLRRPPHPNEARAEPGLTPLPPDAQGNGSSRVIVRHRLGWNSPQLLQGNDPSAAWSIVVTKDLPPIDWLYGPQTGPSLMVGLITPALMMLLFKLAQMRAGRLAAQRELAEQSRQTTEDAQWRTQLNRVALSLQDERQPEGLAFVFLRLTHELIGAARGVVYAKGADEHLHPLGYWACLHQPTGDVAPGQGLIGQVAQDRQPLEFIGPRAIRPDAGQQESLVGSSLGQGRPIHRLVLPLVHLNEVLGVLELDWVSSPTPERRPRAMALARLLTLNLRLMRRTR